MLTAKASAPPLPACWLPATFQCKLLPLLQDSQNLAHPWPRGQSCMPGQDGMAPRGKRGCGRGCMVGRVRGAPGCG